MIKKEIYYNSDNDLYYIVDTDLEYYDKHPNTFDDAGTLTVLAFNEDSGRWDFPEDKFYEMDTHNFVRKNGDRSSMKKIIADLVRHGDCPIENAASLEFIHNFKGFSDAFEAADAHHRAYFDTEKFMEEIEYRACWEKKINPVELEMYFRVKDEMENSHNMDCEER